MNTSAKPTRYPSQYEAETVLEAFLAVGNISLGYCDNTNISKRVKEWREQAYVEYTKVFLSPHSSPWEIIKRRNKDVVRWRKDWN